MNTPRTDAARISAWGEGGIEGSIGFSTIPVEFCRELERELAAKVFEYDNVPCTDAKEMGMGCYRVVKAENELAALKEQLHLCNVDQFSTAAELAAAMAEADAMEEFLGAAAKREKEASAIIESLAADIHITVPLRDYTEMSPKDCYELGMMDGVAALKSQINAAIDAAMKKEMK